MRAIPPVVKTTGISPTISMKQVWIDAKTGEVFNHCMMINRYVREYQVALVDAVKADLASIK